MNVLVEIPMESDWLYFYAKDQADDYSLPSSKDKGWVPLNLLDDWAVTNSIKTGADWFRRVVYLQPADECVRYLLHIEHVPEQVSVYVNGALVATVHHGEELKTDVTDHVALGENLFALKLVPGNPNAGGGFKRIYLEQVACE